MSAREALAESLAVWDLNDPQRNDAMLDTILEAAYDRLAQLPEKCRHGKTGEHWVPVEELPPGVNNAVCLGKVYPAETVERIAAALGCDRAAGLTCRRHDESVVAVLGALHAEIQAVV